MLFAALLGGHLLNEGDRLARLAGAVLIAAGVVALALGLALRRGLQPLYALSHDVAALDASSAQRGFIL